MHISVIDPGHGGREAAGRSTPYGAGQVLGADEKEFNLRLAERVAHHLGSGAVMTRRGDVNLSLAERAAVARRRRALAFVSLHASAAPGAGPRVYVHPRSSGSSSALAHAIGRALGLRGDITTAEMAVLSPAHHDPRTAACLVELDLRAHGPGEFDRLGRAIAGAIAEHLHGGARTAPARALSSVEHSAEIDALKEKVRALAAAGQNPAQYRGTLETLRALLLAAIREEDLKWFTLELKMGERGEVDTGYTIEVCSPVLVSGLFVPVTAQETWDMATKFGALPLSRAVADQQVNAAVDRGDFVEFSPQTFDTHGPGFDVFTERLKRTRYIADYGNAPVGGSHKLWLLSALTSDAKPVNYGFHHHGPRLPYAQGASGKYLYAGYSVVNGLIRAHDWGSHWDYSQLLQLMRGLRADGEPFDLRQALLDRHPAVWDEDAPPERLPA